VLARELRIEIPRPAAASRERASGSTRPSRWRRASIRSRRSWPPRARRPAPISIGAGGRPPSSPRASGSALRRIAGTRLVSALARRRIPASLGEQAGLLKQRRRGGTTTCCAARSPSPIQDARGRVIGFGGRALGAEQEPKYLNTLGEPGLPQARGVSTAFPSPSSRSAAADRAVVVEALLRCDRAPPSGDRGVVATCGTALTEGHARNLRRRTRNLVLLFDRRRGRRARGSAALEVVLPHGLRVRADSLPAGQDPDDFLTARGAAGASRPWSMRAVPRSSS